ncbi:conserved hypothetical protein [Altererythrobacter sp. B11]|uniref:DOMON-like domain-containing protein n=1 Tax=Altererythrobacter sp. B11 TaxID=2060312 RepID=UPI000DC6F43E|nr:DOMON-like domain-containing protein [Altererythrobacter sp. B11]BBC73089.1 conserved hypothetical protein [Altererythrobacter sp. B11]
MQNYPLTAHPDFPPLAARRVEARVIGADANWLRLRWRIDGVEKLVVPSFGGKGRADGLWQTTCFELFLRPDGGSAYCEFNLSPSERWAAYDFASYREGMSERLAPREPNCTMRLGQSMAIFDAAIPLPALPAADCAMGFSAVIEEEGGTKSYWALAHPAGKPDFHDAACFTGRLAAPEAA